MWHIILLIYQQKNHNVIMTVTIITKYIIKIICIKQK